MQALFPGKEQGWQLFPEYFLIKVNQFDDVARDSLDEWIYFLKNEEIKDEFSARGLQEAKSKLDVMKLPEAERRAYERYLEDLSYQASMIQSSYGIGKKEGWKEGREEGREVGKEESRRQIAQAMKAEDVSMELIAKTTGLSVDEITGL